MSRAASRRALLCLALAAGLSGCADWFESSRPPPLPGERVAVLAFTGDLKPDEGLEDTPIQLPRPVAYPDWPQAGGSPGHVGGHHAGAETLRLAWRIDLGTASDDDGVILASPVVADGRIHAIDAEGRVTSADASSGRVLWRRETRTRAERNAIASGGLGVSGGRLFVAMGSGELAAFDAATGAPLWREPAPGPLRSPPTIADGRVFVVSIDSQTVAFDAESGRRLWTHSGIAEIAGLLGAASPAHDAGILLTPYASGEIFALRPDTGRVIWGDNLTVVRRADAISSLAAVRGLPVIDRDLVFAASHSGRLAALERRGGTRVWELSIASTQMPWVAGDWVFVLSTEGDLVAVTRDRGRVKWLSSLPRFRDEARKRDPLIWVGPVLLGDRLVVASQLGDAMAVSPYTGEALGRVRLAGGAPVAPVVAGGTLYFVTARAELLAYR